jgi:hypothetical protein
MNAKNCVRCNEPKPINEFHRSRARPDGRISTCRACRADYAHKWYMLNRDAVRAKTRAYKLARRRDLAPGR